MLGRQKPESSPCWPRWQATDEDLAVVTSLEGDRLWVLLVQEGMVSGKASEARVRLRFSNRPVGCSSCRTQLAPEVKTIRFRVVQRESRLM